MHPERTVLPSSKRPPRNHDEVIRTGDFEVVQNDADEERTLLFTGSHKSMLPPKPAQPVATPSMKAPRTPNMNLRGLVRAGQEGPAKIEKTNLRGSVRPRVDAEDRTILRPTSTLPPAMQKIVSSPPPSTPRPAAGIPSVRPAMMPTPYVPMKPQGASVAPVAVPVNAPGGTDRKSDPPGDPPSSVITAKTRIVRARSSMSWAVGLMAVGAIVGLVTAVIARGDADSIIDATASLVDPSHAPAHAGGAAAQAAVLPAFLDSSPKAAPAGTDANPAKGACLDVGESTVSAPVVNTPPDKAESKRTALLQGADSSAAAKPAPPRAAPVAYAAPVRPHPAPAPAAPQPASASTSSGWLANVTPAGAGAPISRPSKASKGGSGGEFENAAAADALAKAQLEASLR